MSEIADSDTDYAKMKVTELKQELKKRGLSTEGKKNELVERLQSSADSALLDEAHDDLLDDDELSDEDVLNDPTIDTPPPKELEPVKEADTEKRHPKKIILNRKVVDDPEPPAEEPVVEPKVEETPTLSAKNKIIITAPGSAAVTTVTGPSLKERLDKRAARFGSTLETKTEAAKPVKTGTTAASVAAPISINSTVNLDTLKKRAERFGTVAPILEKAELEERKKLRINRFGGGSEVTSDTTGAPADKKSVRAARFEIKL